MRIPELEVTTPIVSPGQEVTVTFTPPQAIEYAFHDPTGNHQALGETGIMEVQESTFWWRARHQDAQGEWSQWSAETSFSIIYRLLSFNGFEVPSPVPGLPSTP